MSSFPILSSFFRVFFFFAREVPPCRRTSRPTNSGRRAIIALGMFLFSAALFELRAFSFFPPPFFLLRLFLLVQFRERIPQDSAVVGCLEGSFGSRKKKSERAEIKKKVKKRETTKSPRPFLTYLSFCLHPPLTLSTWDLFICFLPPTNPIDIQIQFLSQITSSPNSYSCPMFYSSVFSLNGHVAISLDF